MTKRAYSISSAVGPMWGTRLLAFSTERTSTPRRAAFSSAASASVASTLMVVGWPVTFQMPFTVNRITTSGKGTASKRPARMQTTILCRFDLKGSGLELSVMEQCGEEGFYRKRGAEMVNMDEGMGSVRGADKNWR